MTGKRKRYWQEGQWTALSTRIKPTISWLSLWLFHHFLSSIPKKQHSNAIQLGFLMKGDSMVLFSWKEKVSYRLWGFNSPWTTTKLYTSGFKKMKSTTEKGAKCIQNKDYFLYIKGEQISSMVKNNETQAFYCLTIKLLVILIKLQRK